MKKLPSQPQDMFRKLNELIDLVNSQQEALSDYGVRIDYLESKLEPADDKPYKIIEMNPSELSQLLDTRRTVTLRIPKGMRIGQALFEAWDNDGDDVWSDLDEWLQGISDTDRSQRLQSQKQVA